MKHFSQHSDELVLDSRGDSAVFDTKSLSFAFITEMKMQKDLQTELLRLNFCG